MIIKFYILLVLISLYPISSQAIKANTKTCKAITTPNNKLTTKQLKKHIDDARKVNPNLKSHSTAWDNDGKLHILTTVLEVKLKGDTNYSELAIHGYPVKEGRENYVYYRVHTNSRGTLNNEKYPILKKINIKELLKMGTETLDDVINSGEKNFIIPSKSGSMQFTIGKFQRTTDKSIYLKLPDSSTKRLSKEEVYIYHSIFKGSNDYNMASNFFSNGGEGSIILVTPEQAPNTTLHGLYIYPTKLPDFSKENYFDKLAFYNMNQLLDSGTPLLIMSSSSGAGGVFLPNKSDILVAVEKGIRKKIGPSIVVNSNTSTDTIIHEKQHLIDRSDGTLQPIMDYLNNINLKEVEKNGLKLSDNEWVLIFTVLNEQRAYATQINWLQTVLSKKKGSHTTNDFIPQKIPYKKFSQETVKQQLLLFNRNYIGPITPILDKIKKIKPEIFEDIMTIYSETQVPSKEIDLIEILN